VTVGDGEDCEPRFGIQGDVVGDGEDCEPRFGVQGDVVGDGEDCEPRFGIQGDVVGDGEDCEVDCDEAPISTGGSGVYGEADLVTVA